MFLLPFAAARQEGFKRWQGGLIPGATGGTLRADQIFEGRDGDDRALEVVSLDVLRARHSGRLRHAPGAACSLLEFEHVEQVIEPLLRRPLETLDDLINVHVVRGRDTSPVLRGLRVPKVEVRDSHQLIAYSH